MKKYITTSACLVLAGAMLLSGCGKEEEAVAEATLTAVEVSTAQRSTINKKVSYAGKITANQTVNVTSKASGQVKEIFFDVGDYVNKGDVLFKIDTKDINDQIRQLQSSLKVSQAGVASAKTAVNQAADGGQTQTAMLQLENAVTTAEKSLANAQVAVDNANVSISTTKAAMDTAKASFDDNATKYENYKVMYEGGVIAKNDFDNVELAYTSSKNSYEQAKNSYEQAQLALTSAQNQLAQAEAGYQQAQDSLAIYSSKTIDDNKETASNSLNSAVASRGSVETQLSVLRSNLKDYTVTAPISGVISARNIEVTNMVSSAAVPFTITDTATVTVTVDVSEKIINNINVGDAVDVSVSQLPDEEITGAIKTINTVADAKGTYEIEVNIPNKDGLLKPGMYANISFINEHSDNTIVMPYNTVVEKGGQKYVFLLEGSAVKKTIVETGLSNGTDIEITSGVNEGDTVVTVGQNYVSDGETVNVVKSGEAK